MIENWTKPIPFPLVGAKQIHVWSVDLEPTDDRRSACEAVLSDDERERAARFIFDKHRHRFVAGRGQVREILAKYLGCGPHELHFVYANLGKPSLADSRGDLRFNFSNSSTRGLLAVAVGLELGVDIERLRPVENMLGLAKRFFDASEVAHLDSVDEEGRQAAFFHYWTRKEAYLKAVGQGLSFPLNRVLVASDPEAQRYDCIDDDRAETCQWTVTRLEPAAGYVGALTRRSSGDSVRTFRWT